MPSKVEKITVSFMETRVYTKTAAHSNIYIHNVAPRAHGVHVEN